MATSERPDLSSLLHTLYARRGLLEKAMESGSPESKEERWRRGGVTAVPPHHPALKAGAAAATRVIGPIINQE